jgi:isoamylase
VSQPGSEPAQAGARSVVDTEEQPPEARKPEAPAEGPLPRAVELLKFTKGLIALRRRHPVFRRRRFLTGPAAADLRWFTPAGTEMTDQNWTDAEARAVAFLVDGSADPDVAPDGTPLIDDDFLILVNAWWEPLTSTMPAAVATRGSQIVCDTFDLARNGAVRPQLQVWPRSTVILRSPR